MPPAESTGILWQVAERFGFPAFVCVCLGLFMWSIGRQMIAELGRLTRAVTQVVIAMQFAPQFHQVAKDLYDESLAAAKRRKDDLSTEHLT